MPLGEFDLIERYFRAPGAALLQQRGDVALGIGDDAALLQVPAGFQLVAALDTLVEGRHFPAGTPGESLGHRALAVNLSDLAAMGAEPAWFLLALTMPDVREEYLERLARGLLNLATGHRIALVGGDTTAGPLAVSVQALGLVEPGMALRRDSGKPGDLLFVSGHPGEAAAGLLLEMGRITPHADEASQHCLRQRFLYPTPRVELGRALRGLATACIDVSDGLAADVGKLAAASNCGARIAVERLPRSAELQSVLGGDEDAALRAMLTGGDDYELCFTVAPSRVSEMAARLTNVKCPVTHIGVLEEAPGMRVVDRDRPVTLDLRGYDHFLTRG